MASKFTAKKAKPGRKGGRRKLTSQQRQQAAAYLSGGAQSGGRVAGWNPKGSEPAPF